MKIFFDTEFTGLHQNTTLISIGLISDDDKTFYAELTDYDESQLNDWLKENVINNLILNEKEHGINSNSCYGQHWRIKGNIEKVKNCLKTWLYQFKKVEFWSDVLAYDWILLNNLIADYSNDYPELPEHIYYIPFDIATLFKVNKIDPDINREEFVKDELKDKNIKKHNALFDAEIIKLCYEKFDIK